MRVRLLLIIVITILLLPNIVFADNINGVFIRSFNHPSQESTNLENIADVKQNLKLIGNLLGSEDINSVFIAFRGGNFGGFTSENGGDGFGDYLYYGNSQYESIIHSLAARDDFLKQWISELRAAGYKVHAWVPLFNDVSLLSHPELIGKTRKDIEICPGFVNPNDKAVRDFELNIIKEIANNYDVDGINIDYIRYDDTACGRSKYNTTAITTFVESVRNELNKIEQTKGKKIILSADLFPESWGPKTVGQDKSALAIPLDVEIPMIYTESSSASDLLELNNEVNSHKTKCQSNCDVVPALKAFGLKLNEGEPPFEKIKKDILETRKANSNGYVLFAYNKKTRAGDTFGLVDYVSQSKLTVPSSISGIVENGKTWETKMLISGMIDSSFEIKLNWPTSDNLLVAVIDPNNNEYTGKELSFYELDPSQQGEWIIKIYGAALNSNIVRFTVSTNTIVHYKTYPAVSAVRINPSSPTNLDSVEVLADITDSNEIIKAETRWSTDQSSWTTNIMSNVGGPVYQTNSNIAAKSSGAKVYYKVCAVNKQNNEGCSQTQSYTVGQAPAVPVVGVISLNPNPVTQGQSTSISVSVSDANGNSDISSVNAHVKLGSSIVSQTSLSYNLGTGIASGQIPALSQLRTYDIEVEASDSTGLKGYNAAQLTVSEAPSVCEQPATAQSFSTLSTSEAPIAEPPTSVGGAAGSDSGFSSQWVLSNVKTSKDVQTSDPYDTITETMAFSSRDKNVYAWVKFENVEKPLEVKWEWWDPQGKLLTTCSITTTAPPLGQTWPWYKTWCNMGISGYSPASTPGEWKTKIYVDGSLFSSINFYIRYDITDRTMTHGHDTVSPYNPIDRTTTFSRTDERAEAWTKWSFVADPLNIKTDFYDPSGDLYWSGTLSTSDPFAENLLYYNWHKTWGYICVNGYPAADKCGQWHIDISENNQVRYVENFKITDDLKPNVEVVNAPQIPGGNRDNVALYVTGIDNCKLSNIEVKWTPDGTTWGGKTLSASSSPYLSSVNIGKFLIGTTVQYHATASDSFGNTYTTPTHSFKAVDLDPPVLNVKYLSPQTGWPTDKESVTIGLEAYDNYKLDRIDFYWNNGTEHKETFFSDGSASNTFEELVMNGGFDSGMANWEILYQQVGSFSGYPKISITDGKQPGNKYLAIDVPGNAVAEVGQKITLPNSDYMQLSFKTFGDYDTTNVEVRFAGQIIDTFAPPKTAKGENPVIKSYDIGRFKGQTGNLSFHATSSGGTGTYANFDDVSITSIDPVSIKATKAIGPFKEETIVTYYAHAYDKAGFYVTLEPHSSFTVKDADTTGPTILNVTVADDDGKIRAGKELTIAWNATDESGISKMSISVDGNAINTTYINGVYAAVIGPLLQGDYFYTITAIDDDDSPITSQYRGWFHVNGPPKVTLPDFLESRENETITITPIVSDPDNDPITISYSSPLNEDGEWTSTFDDSGNYIINVTVSDGFFDIITSINLTISNVNRPPVIANIPDQTAYVGSQYNYQIPANDPDNENKPKNDDDILTHSTDTKMFAINDNGKISFTPLGDDYGTHNIQVEVSDGEFAAKQNFKLDVLDNTPPTVNKVSITKLLVKIDTPNINTKNKKDAKYDIQIDNKNSDQSPNIFIIDIADDVAVKEAKLYIPRTLQQNPPKGIKTNTPREFDLRLVSGTSRNGAWSAEVNPTIPTDEYYVSAGDIAGNKVDASWLQFKQFHKIEKDQLIEIPNAIGRIN